MRLGDEHIVPFSIGGQHIIEDASCDACANITKKFEQDVMRGIWGDARVSYGAPTRRKKERKQKTHIILDDPKGSRPSLRIPYSEYPAPMFFYRMNTAGLLQGMPETVDISQFWQITTVVDQAKLDAFEKSYPGRLTAKFRHQPISFARLLAKIGYGHILTTLDPSDFRPICLPYILGTKVNVSFVVGGEFEPPPPQEGLGYALGTAVFGTHERIMIVAEIRLLANNRTPRYHVVVGDVHGVTNVERILPRIGSLELVRSSHDALSLPPLTSEKVHCMPTAWPLPFWTG